MPAVELGKGPKDGANSAEASTDVSSADVTRTLGVFNVGEGIAVSGESQGVALSGRSAAADGIMGTAQAQGRSGVAGFHAGTGNGVFGRSARGDGISGVSDGEGMSGVAGVHGGNGNAIYGRAASPGRAAYFEGKVVVHGGDIELSGGGDIKLLGGDIAEDFGVLEAGSVDPGTVMVLHGIDQVRASTSAYDRRVVGIVAGAGEYRPAMILDHGNAGSLRQPIALVGKTFCKVDATYGPVAVGDLLTTSPTAGHAMKAVDGNLAFGAVLGKAMAPLAAGTGLVPVIVMLS